MIIYYALLGGIFFFALFFDFFNVKNNQKLPFYILLSVFIFLLAACRYNSDPDYQSYIELLSKVKPINDMFSTPSSFFTSFYGGPFFTIICSLIKTFSLPKQSLFFIYAFLGVLLPAQFIWKYVNRYQFFSLFIFYCLFFFGGGFVQIRYGVACAILFIAIPYINNKRYLLFSMISVCFHFVGIIGFVLYIYNKFVKDRFVFILPIAFFPFCFIDIISFLKTHLSSVLSGSRYELYLTSSLYSSRSGWILIFLSLILLLIFRVNNKAYRLYKNDVILNASIKYLSLSVIIGSIATSMNILARFGVIFQWSLLLLIPIVLCRAEKSIYFLGYILIFTVYLFIKFHSFMYPTGYILSYSVFL